MSAGLPPIFPSTGPQTRKGSFDDEQDPSQVEAGFLCWITLAAMHAKPGSQESYASLGDLSVNFPDPGREDRYSQIIELMKKVAREQMYDPELYGLIEKALHAEFPNARVETPTSSIPSPLSRNSRNSPACFNYRSSTPSDRKDSEES